MTKIKLPCYGIVVTLSGDGGSIKSNREMDVRLSDTFEAALDAIESMILAHAIAGVDVSSPMYVEGIETAVDKIAQKFG
jgi:hypothetical protein